MAGSEAPPNLKLLLIGNSSVGKSSLLMRFTDAQFLPEDESSATIGVDFRVCKMEIGGRRVKLSIWDTAGQERFRTITSSYYRGAQGIIVAYDISNRETFDALPRWFTELDTYVTPSVVKMLVGNKLDKEFSRAVSEDEGRKFAQRNGCLFLEASAKTNVGVREAFQELVEKILDTPELWAPAAPRITSTATAKPQQSMPGSIDLSANAQDNASSGCSC
ncbi:probable Ras-related protein Rab-18 [Serendipita indica DSM 11827]|uniref:Probable Ras-related protein Rab-18 n=1 Tax=Serendipita indica (strain DSM 11827) TaxID=1109443 RepID=G4TJQ4_SERID|nr:probable Ras-related protein Rab-18 [Serendipita indica DSM 11827]